MLVALPPVNCADRGLVAWLEAVVSYVGGGLVRTGRQFGETSSRSVFSRISMCWSAGRKSHPRAKVGDELCDGFGCAGAVVADAAGCASFRPADDVQPL